MLEAKYDAIAEWYDNFVRNGSQFVQLTIPPLLDLCGPVAGLKLCDLGCGQGVVSRELARRGANVTGLDLSAKLLEIAEHEEQAAPLGITYFQDDAQNAQSQPSASFDGVVCNMALMDIPDLEAVFATTYRLLKPNGWFAFCLTHPCFKAPHSRWLPEAEAWGAVNYFQEGFWRSNYPHGVRGQVGAYHRTVSTYLNTLVKSGFQLEQMLEPQGDAALIARFPELAHVPSTMLVRCRK